MSERHQSGCALEDEPAKQTETSEAQDQEGSEAFSPRDYQEGFWGN